MSGFEINIQVYNMPLSVIVTPIDSKFCRFKVETVRGKAQPMILTYRPDCSWIVEQASMKFFTLAYVGKLGALIKNKKPEWFLMNKLKKDLP
ncbi:hypothetical protein [Mucilaginibacter paludis]|uniref:Uncharacterized protein n=1 Tax=Mucilaginibacter paludis DSM 18603 TaxID=714943 RepID=H1Y633_9SPHI|nr:hypothetical protein [Mucilaginibacter paludis]EHQ30992.1 hypothetical protein Mucpa_6944 [Mucilaginibacter paludis DSM 18603]